MVSSNFAARTLGGRRRISAALTGVAAAVLCLAALAGAALALGVTAGVTGRDLLIEAPISLTLLGLFQLPPRRSLGLAAAAPAPPPTRGSSRAAPTARRPRITAGGSRS